MEQGRGSGAGVGGGGGGGHEMRGTKHQQLQQQHPPPQQPQKCPRCDSLNTKFCYYNNYSLSQPRYFCKTCRRYWTQGGTLRNVPVGGGCRKGKRLKRSSSPSPEDQVQHVHSSSISSHTTSSLGVMRNKGMDNNSIPLPLPSPLVPIAAAVPPPSMYYPGGGFLSSLTPFQSFNQQPMNVHGGGEFGGSNLGLLQGFSFPFSTQQMHHHQHLQQQQQQQQQLQQLHHQQQEQEQEHQLYLHQSHDLNLGSSDDFEEKFVQSNRPSISSSHQEWSHSQTFTNPITSETVGYWSSNTNQHPNPTPTPTTTINNSTTSASASASASASTPTHWTDHLANYGPPQPPPSTTTTSSSSPPSFL